MKYKFLGPVYRHVTKEQYANDLVNGIGLRVSTIQTCRDYEDKEQGDAEEGYLHHLATRITDQHPRGIELASQIGIKISGDSTNYLISNNRRSTIYPDAYVICLSHRIFDDRLKGKFGKYVVRINNVRLFMHHIVLAMKKCVPTKTLQVRSVRYVSRTRIDFEESLGNAYFVKPPNPFAEQKEYRIIVLCEPGHKYVPFNLEVPFPPGLCTRVE